LADAGLASPNNFTNSAGIFNWTSGNVTTTLNLGGANNQHDCTSGGASAGNTPASRSAYYELNRIAELARGWLPSNAWLNQRLTTNVNLNQTCNAFWNGTSVNFFRSGGGCRNTGEIAGVFDHEWGHGLDDNDAAGALSNSSEAYADIAAIYRLQTSCVGYGFFQTLDDGCGQTADGTGFNVNEAQAGAAHCATNCSGVRDADFQKHSPLPLRPLSDSSAGSA
jgi:trimeric autotransporter adhesin